MAELDRLINDGISLSRDDIVSAANDIVDAVTDADSPVDIDTALRR